MKLLILLAFPFLSSFSPYQRKMAEMNRGRIQITTLRKPACGDKQNDFVLTLKNVGNIKADYIFYFKFRNGKWSDARGGESLVPYKTYEVPICDTDGQIYMFVRDTGSDEKFPSRREFLNQSTRN